ncbi:MAG: hypothetical protein ACYC91_04660 [Solirubrobacteraceae bacterium]
MRNPTLFAILEAFTADAASRLSAATASGAEVPFELIEAERGSPAGPPLYCYRPLTGSFIRERLGILAVLPSYLPAVRALAALEGVEGYLRQRGEARIPAEPRDRAEAALRCLLTGVFEDRSEFGLVAERFAVAFDQLEHAVYEGRSVTTVIAPLLGVALDPRTRELPLGDGLSLVPGDALEHAPAEAVWGVAGAERQAEEPNMLAVLTVAHDRAAVSPIPAARQRFRRVLTALRLFERGGYALGPIAWIQVDKGAWRPVPFGGSGRPRLLTLIPAAQEDELRAFCNLIARRAPTGGEVAWALARFEMGCERIAPFEALTDYLLALRALLEPEGPSTGRMAQRLAVICARSEDRAALAARTARAIALERSVIAGVAPGQSGLRELVDELAEHLRAILRDVICGHLDVDLRGFADELLGQAAEATA